ncbi:hypothetical protein [Listeria fleischmannii]|uniref:Uncharacterized protein n=1 Tax=Listeria fleischmannii FSL S10-1203 TaxID=1265822 RepID=W7D610_9LIST|nr:hypothetical protein [Listeria fleischmannii]EUJ43251.1 hypothetical protein MCOL2_20553 [Listeria fleischmannii FSL S10-1203]
MKADNEELAKQVYRDQVCDIPEEVLKPSVISDDKAKELYECAEGEDGPIEELEPLEEIPTNTTILVSPYLM